MRSPHTNTVPTSLRKLLATVIALAALSAGLRTQAAVSTWDQAIDGGNWTDLRWTGGVAGPTTPGNSAVIDNKIPANWSSGSQTILVNTPLDLDAIYVIDSDPPIANQIINLQFSNSGTVTSLIYTNDSGGNGRSLLTVPGGVTLSVNTMDITGRFADRLGNGSGTITFFGIGGVANYKYYDGHEQYGGNATWNFTDPTTVNYWKNGDQGDSEGRDVTWLVGNAAGNQTWVIKNSTGTLVGSPHPLIDRNAGNGWNFVKTGAFDVDMGSTAGVSDGISIRRYTTGNFGSHKNVRLFTDAAGGAASGTVKIGEYIFREVGTSGDDVRFVTDALGANLTITAGGFNMISNGDGNAQNDLNIFGIRSGRTLKAEGTTTGNIIVNDSNATTQNRMGIYFAGATLWAEQDLSLLGAQTFLNDGGSASTIRVGRNLTVQSQSATGYSGAVANSPSAPIPANDTADNFDLRATTMILNGPSHLLTWDTAAATGSTGSLAPGDFSQSNFTVNDLLLTGSSATTFLGLSDLWLDTDLVIDPGSSLYMQLGQIHVLDPDGSEVARVSGYVTGGQIQHAFFIQTPGVGFTLASIPEPGTALLALIGGLVAWGWRRR